MKDNYSIKVNLLRVAFMLLAACCWILYRQGLTDYIILIIIVIIIGGIFSVSTMDLKSREVAIKKSYFWGLVTIKRNVMYDQILSIKEKEYIVDTHEGTGIFSPDIFSFTKGAKVSWLTTKLSYEDNGINKSIEVKTSKDNVKLIEKQITTRDSYQSFL